MKLILMRFCERWSGSIRSFVYLFLSTDRNNIKIGRANPEANYQYTCTCVEMCTYYSLFCFLTSLRLEQPPLLNSVTERIEEYPSESYYCNDKHNNVGTTTHFRFIQQNKQYENISISPEYFKYHIAGVNLTLVPTNYDKDTTWHCLKKDVKHQRDSQKFSQKSQKALPTEKHINMKVIYYKDVIDIDCSMIANGSKKDVSVLLSQNNELELHLNNRLVIENGTDEYNGSIVFCQKYLVQSSGDIQHVYRKTHIIGILVQRELIYFNIVNIYAVIAIQSNVILFIILLFLYFIRKNNKQVVSTSILQEPQTTRHTDDNQILYADLAFNSIPSRTTSSNPIEESPYAQIVIDGQVMYAELELHVNPRSGSTSNTTTESPYAQIIIPNTSRVK